MNRQNINLQAALLSRRATVEAASNGCHDHAVQVVAVAGGKFAGRELGVGRNKLDSTQAINACSLAVEGDWDDMMRCCGRR